MDQQVHEHVTDVLIIGSGGAGLRTAIELSDAGVDVLVVGKCEKREAHTKVAQGGMNAALGNVDPEDNWTVHAADTIVDGGYINDPIAVELLCKHAPQAVEELANWGTDFARDEDGNILQRPFGAATYRRTCFVGDYTGLAMLNTLVDQVEQRDIAFQSRVYITSLLDRDGVVNGALGVNLETGELHVYHAKLVVLATGGHSRMFKRSSSHFWENNGDGIALAARVGAQFMDMEMFQFHPTGMVWPEEAEGLLTTEAVRGEGGILTNKHGERFMEKYDRKRMELSARDVVARANWTEIIEGRGTDNSGVYLDISHKPAEFIHERLPDMVKQYQEFCGIDITKEKMEVAPTAHYSMGGVCIDHHTGKTDVEGLYAVGEIASGVHGGNRLGGNSLAEIVVFGRLTGQSIVGDLSGKHLVPIDPNVLQARIDSLTKTVSNEGEDPIAVKKELQQIMWQHVGVVRTAETMQAGLNALASFNTKTLKTGSSFADNEALIAALDIANMLPTCEMILQSALMREESRAAHFRSDYPETSDNWKKNIVCTPNDNGFSLSTRAVADPSPEVQKAIAKHESPEVHLLE